jgi:hypothetical protein
MKKFDEKPEPDLKIGARVTKEDVMDAIKNLPDLHADKTPEQRAEIIARRKKNTEIWNKILNGEMTVRESNPTLYDAIKETFEESAKAKGIEL